MTSAGVDRIFTIRGLLTQKLQTLRLKKKGLLYGGHNFYFLDVECQIFFIRTHKWNNFGMSSAILWGSVILLGLLGPWRWDRYVFPKRRYGIIALYCVISQKRADLVLSAAEDWNHVLFRLLYNSGGQPLGPILKNQLEPWRRNRRLPRNFGK